MATPKLALIPTGYKAGKLYSVLPESGVGDFTVVRATEATRVNEEGLIETMGANVPRLDYSGGGCPVLLTEPQSTNLIAYSEDFSQWSQTRVINTDNEITSPDGSLNASLITEDSTLDSKYTFLTPTVTINEHTLSFFGKYKGRYLQVLFGTNDVSGNPYINFDLQNGIFDNNGVTNPSIEFFGNGWYKCSLTVTSAVTTGFGVLFSTIPSLTSSRLTSYQGDGTSGVYIWGAQLEQASYPTSYIKTEGFAVTRNGDQVTGAGDAATFNDSEGVLMAEISALANDGTFRFISLKNNTTVDIIRIGYITTPNRIEVQNYKSGALFNSFNYEVQDLKNNTKVAFKWKDNDFQLYINGLNVLSNTSVTAWGSGVFQSLQFDQHNGGNNFYGNTKQLQYFNSALTDSELETLTSWASFIEMAQAQNYNII